MKQIISMVIVCMLFVGVMFTLASCAGGIDNGTYSSSKGSTIEIDGNKYTVNATIGGESLEITYTYEVKNDENNSDAQRIYLTYESSNASGDVKAGLESSEPFSYSYEKCEDGFVINGTKYTKK